MTNTAAKESIAFLGLGALGAPIAANLLASGVALTVWNRTASKAQPLLQLGAANANSPSEAITRGSIVFTILWDDASLEELALSDSFLDALGPGGVHVSMTTVTPETAHKVAAAHEARGSSYVEAPIFGIPAQAVARDLTVCMAGPTAAKARVQPLLEAMGGKRIVDFGEAIGAGTATKLVGNFVIISSFVAVQEAFDVLTKNGIDPKPILEMLRTTPFFSAPASRYAGYLVSGQPLSTSGIPLKDVSLFERLATAGDQPAPLAKQLLASLEARTQQR